MIVKPFIGNEAPSILPLNQPAQSFSEGMKLPLYKEQELLIARSLDTRTSQTTTLTLCIAHNLASGLQLYRKRNMMYRIVTSNNLDNAG